MSKDELAARREARKRRILENSEKRLTKIISCDKSVVSDSEVHVFDNEWKHCNGIVTSSKQENDEPVVHPTPIDHLQSDEGVNGGTAQSVAENLQEHLLRKETSLNSKECGDKTQTILRVDCLFIIFLSFMVRLMYEYNMSYMFGESLLIPFITISVAKIAANPTQRNSKLAICGSIIKASLLLSGVPNTWLDKIFLFIQVVIDLGNDFALYLFSFTLSHIFLESFVMR